MIAVDNTTWIGVHVYAMDSWERKPQLLYLSCILEDGSSDHLIQVIMNSLIVEEGLSHEEIAYKFVCFGSDGVATFQGVYTGVATQIHEKWVSFSLAANCGNHRINLVV